MQNPPRPSLLLLFNALMLIAGCLALLAYFVWILATMYRPVLALCAPLMLCVPPLIAAMQYRAVFGRNEHAARNVGKYLFLAGGLLAIFFAMMTCIYAGNDKEVDPVKLEVSSGLTIASIYLLYCGQANQRWARELRQAEEKDTPEESEEEE